MPLEQEAQQIPCQLLVRHQRRVLDDEFSYACIADTKRIGNYKPRLQSMKTKKRTFLTRQIRELSRITKLHQCSAKTLAGTVLASWCQINFPSLPCSTLPTSTKLAREKKLVAFLETLRTLDFIEGAYWLSSLYAIASDKNRRKKQAMFFTPPSLAKGLLDDLTKHDVNFTNRTFLDPACGGAAFLVPIALMMRETLLKNGITQRKMLQHIEKRLHGTDIDIVLCELSKQFLRMALHDDIQKTNYLPEFKIYRLNSLTELASLAGTIDMVVCNPPYRKVTINELKPLRKTFRNVIQAQPNLYGLFISLCLRFLREDGYAAIITPTSFLSGQYFSKLRSFLIQNTNVVHIGIVSRRQGVFIDVEQETALTILRRQVKASYHQRKTKISIVSLGGEYKNIGKSLLPNGGSVWPIPRSAEDIALLRTAETLKFRLSDYGYRIRIGAFVWNRDERPVYFSATELKTQKDKLAVPLIWSSDIKNNGFLHFDGMEKENGEPRFVNFGDKNHRSVIRRPSVLLQRVTSNEQSRRLIAAAIPQNILSDYGGFVGENHTVILEQVTDKPTLTPKQIAKIFSVDLIDRMFRCISGTTNVSSFELGQLSLPNPELLRQYLNVGIPAEEAVRMAYYTSNNMFSKTKIITQNHT